MKSLQKYVEDRLPRTSESIIGRRYSRVFVASYGGPAVSQGNIQVLLVRRNWRFIWGVPTEVFLHITWGKTLLALKCFGSMENHTTECEACIYKALGDRLCVTKLVCLETCTYAL